MNTKIFNIKINLAVVVLATIAITMVGMASTSFATVVKYNFDVDYKTVNYSGEKVQALAVDGGIPAPTIKATIGDTLQITFNNKMDEETSIHWHGLLVPNDQDGVPYLNTKPIPPKKSFTFEFKVKQTGTYWYHSHTDLQEQQGVYGAIVFSPKVETVKVDYDKTIVLSDWSDRHPLDILRELQSSRGGHGGGMMMGGRGGMGSDVSDIEYDAFLANGETQQFYSMKPGSTARLRLINGGAGTYFNVQFANMTMKVIAADGMDIQPIEVEQLLITNGETYDVLVTIPDSKRYELRAMADDASGYSSVLLGSGKKVVAVKGQGVYGQSLMRTPKVRSNGVIPYMNDYKFINSKVDTTLPKRKTQTVNIDLTGGMMGYDWGFNGKKLDINNDANWIKIKQGTNVRIVIRNKSMMSHPIHLHGHFFRVINGRNNKNAPLKHTVNVKPMETVVIEFAADEEKDWLIHCHLLFHMAAGMGTVISYQ